jgi:phage gp45-like
MSGSPKEKLQTVRVAEEVSDEREVYLRDGRKLVVGEQGGDQLVEIRSESGMLEVRIVLTEQGPILQMESARLSLKASEAVEIESRTVTIKGTEQLTLAGAEVEVRAEEDVEVTAEGDVRVVGKAIFLN